MFNALTQDLSQSYSGFGYDGGMTDAIAVELRKALDTGGYQISNQTGGAALTVQSLHGTAVTTSWTNQDLVWTKLLARTPAFSTVEEFTEWVDYGSATGGFVMEGEAPASSTSNFIRKLFRIKYLATVRGLTHQLASLHPAFGSNVEIETRGGMLWLSERAEQAIVKGDATLAAPNTEGVEFNGLMQLIDPTSIVDCQNRPLSQPLINSLAKTLRMNKAHPDSLVLGIPAQADLVTGYLPHGRFQMPMVQDGKLGLSVNKVDTSVGELDLYPSIFLDNSDVPGSTATHANAPAIPAAVAAAVSAGTDGDFNKAAPAGDQNWYHYVIRLGNRFGMSAPVYAAATVQMTAANKTLGRGIDVSVTLGAAPGTFPPEYVAVYRAPVRAAGVVPNTLPLSSYSLVFRAPIQSQTPGAVNVIEDLNTYIPFTSVAFMGQWDEEIINIAELLEPFKLAMGIASLSMRWIQAWYLCLRLLQSRKWGMFLNVGIL